MWVTKGLPKVFVFYLGNLIFLVYKVFLKISALGWENVTMEGGKWLNYFFAK